MRPRKAEFEQAVRLLIEIQTKNPGAPKPVIEITGITGQADGGPEVIAAHQFQWRSGGLVATSQKVYSKVTRLKISGLEEDG